ncbi:hypothetical protein PJM29_30420, partial [Mycobacterium kansasii]
VPADPIDDHRVAPYPAGHELVASSEESRCGSTSHAPDQQRTTHAFAELNELGADRDRLLRDGLAGCRHNRRHPLVRRDHSAGIPARAETGCATART